MEKLGVIGLGYVGLVSAVCLSKMGYEVICIDTDVSKVEMLRKGELPIFEPGLKELLKENKERLKFTTKYEKLIENNINLFFICVGTPLNDDREINLDYIKNSAKKIGSILKSLNNYSVIIYRSTIPPKTSQSIIIPIIEKESNKKEGIDFGYAYNPEFLREGNAIKDFFSPSRIIVGCNGKKVHNIVFNIYNSIKGKKISLSIVESEIIKYIDNTWHALKVVFANEIGYLSKKFNIDGRKVMEVFCEDRKLNLSPYYLKPGFAFGGSCLPKDVKTLVNIADAKNINIPLISSILPSNEKHIEKSALMIKENVPKNGTIVIVGISFKPETDDIREAPSLYLIKKLKEMGYNILCFDPNVKFNKINEFFEKDFLKIKKEDFLMSIDEVFNYKYIVFTGSLKNIPQAPNLYENKWIFDLGGVLYNKNKLIEKCNYFGLCW